MSRPNARVDRNRGHILRMRRRCGTPQGWFGLSALLGVVGLTLVSFQTSTRIVQHTSRRITSSLSAVSLQAFSRRGDVDDTTDAGINGILSNKPVEFFRSIQASIDDIHPHERCARYGVTYNATHPTNRRLFFGALIASEPRELLEIVAAEVYGVYAAMVLVEGNRTQNFTPRPWARQRDAPVLANLFGIPPSRFQIRPYINEDSRLRSLKREHHQRSEILQGWKELGMQPDDVGILADIDETFTRDLLRALQSCDGIDVLEYSSHYCDLERVKLYAHTRVFESTPECLARKTWYHPNAMIGHCIQGIGTGYSPLSKEKDNENNSINVEPHPLWTAKDFRMTRGGRKIHVNVSVATQLALRQRETAATATMAVVDPILGLPMDHRHSRLFDRYTGYHFHNFFANMNATRFKYSTYGHADRAARSKPIYEVSADLNMLYHCLYSNTAADDDDVVTDDSKTVARSQTLHVPGGYNQLARYFRPVYFHDDDYRRRRHAHMQAIMAAAAEDGTR
jgi:Glycosyltransferase family 17